MRVIEVRVDQDVYEPADNVTFAEWCDSWLSGLRRKETTRRSYRPSLEYGKQAIGQKPLRKVTTSDVRAFLEHIERVHKSRKHPARFRPPRWRSTFVTLEPACRRRSLREDRGESGTPSGSGFTAEADQEAAELLHERRACAALAPAAAAACQLIPLPHDSGDRNALW